jgi:flagellar biosynthesis/type III secretory pathway protein FliH
VIWCSAEVRILSDLSGLGGKAVRTAKVWQPMELLYPAAGQHGFVREAFANRTAHSFDVQVTRVWTPPGEADGEPTAPADLMGPVLPESDLAEAEPSVDTLALTQAALEAERQSAYADGLAEGQRQIQSQWDADKKVVQAGGQNILRELDTAVRRLIETPEQLHEPLKRLALHLAEQLVLAELTLSSKAIERLVARCVEELAPQRLAPVTVELNPADLALLQSPTQAGGVPERAWHLQANDNLLPGSVRASASDAVVSDLIEHRLEVMARALLPDSERGLAQSAFQPTRLASRLANQAVQDVEPYSAFKPVAPTVYAGAAPLSPLSSLSPSTLDLSNLDLPDLNLDAAPYDNNVLDEDSRPTWAEPAIDVSADWTERLDDEDAENV